MTAILPRPTVAPRADTDPWMDLPPAAQAGLLDAARRRGVSPSQLCFELGDRFFLDEPATGGIVLNNPAGILDPVATTEANDQAVVNPHVEVTEAEFIAYHSASPEARRAAELELAAIEARREADEHRLTAYVGTALHFLAPDEFLVPYVRPKKGVAEQGVSPGRARQLGDEARQLVREANEAAVEAAKAGARRDRKAVRTPQPRPVVHIDTTLEAARKNLASAQTSYDNASAALDELADKEFDALTFGGVLGGAVTTDTEGLVALLRENPDALEQLRENSLAEIYDAMKLDGASPRQIERALLRIIRLKTPQTPKETQTLEAIAAGRRDDSIGRAEARRLRHAVRRRLPTDEAVPAALRTAEAVRGAHSELGDVASGLALLEKAVSHETPFVVRRAEIPVPFLGRVTIPRTQLKPRRDRGTDARFAQERDLHMVYKRLAQVGPVTLPPHVRQLLDPQPVPPVERIYRVGERGMRRDWRIDDIAEEIHRGRSQPTVRTQRDMQHAHAVFPRMY